jgi:PPOX class probable F420-dependent enzyme
MDLAEARRRFADAAVAHLATVRPDGSPHVVPIVFALEGDTLSFAVDEKPKRSSRLQRITNVAHEPRVSALVDVYDDDWSRLWWVRVDGRAHVVTAGAELERVREALAAKYLGYRDRPPPGPAVTIGVERWRFWPEDRL